jgi:UPF0755 protein
MLFFDKSENISHSIIITKERSFSETIEEDKSFKNIFLFKIMEKIPFVRNKIKNGEYRINKGDCILDFFQTLLKNEIVSRKITIPEGFTVKMIVNLLNTNEYLIDEIKELPEEGSLMPDTYFYNTNDSRKLLLKRMNKQQEKVLQRVLKNHKTTKSKKDIIIIASIIEKETSLDSERPLIASVFENRLDKNMRLQSDPTVIYALSDGLGRLDRPLSFKDLKVASQYNTYRNKGLPPGPICCPGEKSIIAAIDHLTTDYFYFVSDGENKFHRFSKNFADHKMNRQRYKREKKQHEKIAD